MKKFKVTFLLSKKNIWIEKQLREFNFKIKNKYIFKITKNFRIIKGQDIVFAISYLKILPERFIKKNKLVLIPHPSKLPKNKGFAPVQYEILKNKNKLYISIIKAVKEVDSGPICFSGNFKLNGDELSREIREKQGLAILNSIKKVLIKYPNLIFKKQSGKSSFNRRRFKQDSKLDINKTIKAQFNHLRINDNELYPSFFLFKGKKYFIKIFKEGE